MWETEGPEASGDRVEEAPPCSQTLREQEEGVLEIPKNALPGLHQEGGLWSHLPYSLMICGLQILLVWENPAVGLQVKGALSNLD